MGFKDQIELDLAEMLDTDTFADTVTYDGTSISAIVDTGIELIRDSREDVGMIHVAVSAVPTVSHGDPVVIDSNNWIVTKTLTSDGYLTSVHIQRANSITLSRGGQSCSAIATRHDHTHERYDSYNIVVTTKIREYGIRASAYAPAGTADTPQIGDRITDGSSTFEVLSVPGKPHYDYSDSNRTMLIVRTKEI